MVFLNTLWDWSDHRRRTQLFNAKVGRSGVAQSLLPGKDVDRTKYVYEVTVSVLHNLIHDAYNKATPNEDIHAESNLSILVTYDIEKQFYLFLRSIRAGIFQLYQKSLINLLPWFFGHDHYHYA